jgi:predicted esterase
VNLYCYTTKLRQKFKTPGLILQLLLLLLILLADITSAANLSREQRISEGLTAMLSGGSPIWLEADSVRFLGIYSKTSTTRRLGGIILLHDHNTHADWHEVINPLRQHLTKRGWDTLSIQTPITDNPTNPVTDKALLVASLPRIQAAIDFLAEQQVDRAVLVGHGIGARMAIHAITQAGDRIEAVVAIGVAIASNDDQDPLFQAIKQTDIPILDLYGSADHATVIDSAPLRRAIAARNGRNRYRLVEIAGANHFFSGIQEELTHRVAAWLRQTLGPQPAIPPPSAP